MLFANQNQSFNLVIHGLKYQNQKTSKKVNLNSVLYLSLLMLNRPPYLVNVYQERNCHKKIEDNLLYTYIQERIHFHVHTESWF